MIHPSAASRCTRSLLRPAFRPSTLRPVPRLPTPASLLRAFRTSSRSLRANAGPSQSSAFAPPPPSSLPRARPPKSLTKKQERRRARRRALARRLFLYLALPLAGGYAWDRFFNYSAFGRTASTFALGLFVAADYKLNFRPDPWVGSSVTDLHARSARRLFDLLRANGGLYLKIGQAIAMQSAILPPEFQQMFARMFDDAPQNGWRDVEAVIREDFGGKSVEEVFGVRLEGTEGSGREGLGMMERTARASASVAQVHWARLPDGREVAVKIQKREIAAQVGWDLWTFKVLAWAYSRWFDIPFYNLVPYVTERLMLETDFENEAHNGERMAALVAGEPRLRGRVYIPKVFHDLSSKRVMTAEWIEGVRLWDKDSITKPWRGGSGRGSPGCRGTPLDPPELAAHASSPESVPGVSGDGSSHPKPARGWWRGPHGEGGLGLNLGEVMTTMVDLFSAQMFLWGLVHCDPHPGNIFVRRQPSGRAELVLIDHGLYIEMAPRFRHQYAEFWTALLQLDNAAISRIAREWGVRGEAGGEFFASATLMRPYTGGRRSFQADLDKLSKTERNRRHFEMQQQSRKMIRDILGDEDKWPRELLFIGRNLRIVQGNNQFLGSPVNRIKITGFWASRALAESPDLGWAARARNLGRHFVFRLVMLSSDAVFWWSKLRQWLGVGQGMEDDMEAQMRVIAKDMGVDLNHKVFEG